MPFARRYGSTQSIGRCKSALALCLVLMAILALHSADAMQGSREEPREESAHGHMSSRSRSRGRERKPRGGSSNSEATLAKALGKLKVGESSEKPKSKHAEKSSSRHSRSRSRSSHGSRSGSRSRSRGRSDSRGSRSSSRSASRSSSRSSSRSGGGDSSHRHKHRSSRRTKKDGHQDCGIKDGRPLEIVRSDPSFWLKRERRANSERREISQKQQALKELRKRTCAVKKRGNNYKRDKGQLTQEIERLENAQESTWQEESSRLAQKRQTVLVDSQTLGEGGYANVFAGQMNKDAFGPQQCVVVRMQSHGNGECEGEYFNGALILEKLQNTLPREKRKHIIKMIAFGKMQGSNSSSGGGWAMILEKGEADLRARKTVPQSARSVLRNDDEFARLASKIVWPLRELHQVAMHTDFKPDNLVYVPSSSGGRPRLKLIDFDGANWLLDEPDHASADCARVAHYAHVGSKRYRAPEQDQKPATLSRKADIWPVGVILFEMLLLRNTRLPKRALENNLFYALELFRGYTLSENDAIRRLPMERLEWVWIAFASTIKTILTARAELPLTSRLITNALNVEPTKRMSAAGILDYLPGNCLPAEVRSAKHWDAVPLFGRTTLAQLMGELPRAIQSLERATKHFRGGRLQAADVNPEIYSALQQGQLPILRGKGGPIGQSHVEEVLRTLREVKGDAQMLSRIAETEQRAIETGSRKPECDTKTTRMA